MPLRQANASIPSWLCGDDIIESLTIILCPDQSFTQFCERLQGLANGCLFISDYCLAKALGQPVKFTDNTIMGLDNGIGQPGLPFRCTYSKDCKAAVFGQIPHTVSVITLPMSTQSGHPVGWHA
jgi:hypothetical protein